VRASLADQAEEWPCPAAATLAIGLGANLPSPAGDPLATLLALRPLLQQRLQAWAPVPGLRWQWSPLFRTAPVGGPAHQPDYLNAVLLLQGAGPPAEAAALVLLQQLQQLEQQFGRQRRERWGPRSLDLDLLWWGQLRCRGPVLALPHPRWHEREFVLAPLAAIDPALLTVAGLAAALPRLQGDGPVRLAGRPGWPE